MAREGRRSMRRSWGGVEDERRISPSHAASIFCSILHVKIDLGSSHISELSGRIEAAIILLGVIDILQIEVRTTLVILLYVSPKYKDRLCSITSAGTHASNPFCHLKS